MSMKYFPYGVTIALVILLCIPCASDELVIKKKGGASQRIPLNFSPEEIESFRVVPSPGTDEPADEFEPQTLPQAQPQPQPPSPAQSQLQPQPQRQAPAPARPTAQPPEDSADTPMIFRKPPTSAGPKSGPASPPAETATPAEGQAAVSPSQPKPKPGAGPTRPGPTSASTASATGGQFSVNVYKVPENVKTLPDFSALRPVNTLTTERINLDPSKGDNEPAGLGTTDGMGMRFIAAFMVNGEGIFRWRVQGKDGYRLHIDDKTVIENDGTHESASKTAYTHLAEGFHTIILDSFNVKGAPELKLFVQPPTGDELLFAPANGLAGWHEPAKPYDVLWGQVYFVPKGNYPEGPDLSELTPIGRIIASELDLGGGEAIPGLPDRKDMVALRYQGFFNVNGAGIFAFRLVADNFARLTINKQTIVEVSGDTKSDPNGKYGWAFLQQGSYPITVDYFHQKGVPRLQLHVTTPVKEESLLRPAQALEGFASDSGKLSLIPVFAYFVKPGTKKLPVFNKMSPSGMFFAKSIDFPADRGTREFPGVPKREDWLGLRFYVKFTLSEQESGTYKFRVVSADDARLIVGKKAVVNIEAPPNKVTEQSGSVTLNAGSHEMFLDYLQTTGVSALQLYITPPNGEEKIFAFQ